MASYGYTFQSGDGVTPTRLNDARTVSDIVNADIKSDAAIAGTKIAPNFGSQNVTTSGVLSCVGGSGGSAVFSTDGNNASPYFVQLRKSRGSHASPQVVSSGDGLGTVIWYGHDGTGIVQAAAISAAVDGTPGTNDMPGRLVFSTTADGAASVTERMRINSSGSVLIGTTTEGNVGAYFLPSTNERMVLSCGTNTTSSNSLVNFRNTNGIVGAISTNGSATVYATSSDYRLKENATPLTIGLATVDQLAPVEFTWKSDNSTGRGFIAHELQAVVPEAVTGEKDAVDAEGNPQYQGVDASKLVPYLVSAVKELKARVEALEAV